ncbi:DUF1801 domain-containing protein [Pelagibacterium lentulum]|uniref:YdhG-like domain-containing protein n=1 Tax=Pelagibacterium lentulum TaxID=2029865 RepID=A0A916W202_9HYPH|nr:DUF1801 domain-containing protein [Pelagibacterium lentulum]GGA59598.1 hypothetical protein GCM10011499_32220 [Pelagibacterium lentulum]
MTPSQQIDALIDGLGDWRGDALARLRKAILAADAEITEEWKWMGSPVWCCAGNLVVGNAHKDKVKLTFSQGASLADPAGLFNNGFGGKVWRAIDLHQGDSLDEAALTALVRRAVAFNREKAAAKAKKSARPKTSTDT